MVFNCNLLLLFHHYNIAYYQDAVFNKLLLGLPQVAVADPGGRRSALVWVNRLKVQPIMH